MKKITLKEFFDSKEELAIHVKTRKELKELSIAFNKLGRRWRSGELYTKNSCLIGFKYLPNLCLDNKGHCGNTDCYDKINEEIFEFNEIDLEETK